MAYRREDVVKDVDVGTNNDATHVTVSGDEVTKFAAVELL